MPDFSQLDDAALAAVLNFVVFDLGRAAAGHQAPAAGGHCGRARPPAGRRGRARTPRKSSRGTRALTMSRRLRRRGRWNSCMARACWPVAGSAPHAQIPRRTTCSTAWAATAPKPKGCPARFRLWRTRSAASCAPPAGRDYLLRVPGAANSALSDAQLAAVLNWLAQQLIPRNSRADVPKFTAAEVTASRHAPLASVLATRREVVRDLAATGSAPPATY